MYIGGTVDVGLLLFDAVGVLTGTNCSPFVGQHWPTITLFLLYETIHVVSSNCTTQPVLSNWTAEMRE